MALVRKIVSRIRKIATYKKWRGRGVLVERLTHATPVMHASRARTPLILCGFIRKIFLFLHVTKRSRWWRLRRVKVETSVSTHKVTRGWKLLPQIELIQNHGTFRWTVIGPIKDLALNNQITFRLLDPMLSSFSALSLKSYWHFLDLGVEIALSHRHVEKRIQQSTASERTSRLRHALRALSHVWLTRWSSILPT